MSLFSIFDTQSALRLPLNWRGLILIFILTPVRVWGVKSNLSLSMKNLALFVKAEFFAVSQPFTTQGNLLLRLSLFLTVVLINFTGLLPYVLPLSGHLPLAFSLAFPLWVGHVLHSWCTQPQSMLAHLVPVGSPGPLIPFMVLIELVRSLIRPITLSVRLVANIVAGHLLLTLLRSSITPCVGPIVIRVVLCSLVGLRCLETAVAGIQAYVFSVLSTLYVGETDSCLLYAPAVLK